MKERGRIPRYVRHVPPLGHPNSALVCGAAACDRPGLIWLQREEGEAYDRGQRVFELSTAATKVRAL